MSMECGEMIGSGPMQLIQLCRVVFVVDWISTWGFFEIVVGVSKLRSGVRIMKAIILANGWGARVSCAGLQEKVNAFKTKLTEVAVVRLVATEDREREQSAPWHLGSVDCRNAWPDVVGGGMRLECMCAVSLWGFGLGICLEVGSIDVRGSQEDPRGLFGCEARDAGGQCAFSLAAGWWKDIEIAMQRVASFGVAGYRLLGCCYC